ncbi:hypothetical protein P8452_43303 [Trifolium repens]|nr:hypothetical protein P8452_43303 [Trifolium repens]
MVAAQPDWDLLNNPKKKSRRVKNVEKILIDEPDKVNEDEVAEQDDNGSENQGVIGSEKDTVDDAEKERRIKKRNERPSPDEDDNATLSSRLLIKKQKTVGVTSSKASERPEKRTSEASKGMSFETNVLSMSEAQSLSPPTPTIDFTKPISMILPSPQPETVILSSNSEDTVSDSSIQRLIASAPKITPAISSESQEVVSDDNSILNHLSYHMSGDAFASSTLNSPVEQINNATHMHVDTETIIPTNSSQILEPQLLRISMNLLFLNIKLRYLKKI